MRTVWVALVIVVATIILATLGIVGSIFERKGKSIAFVARLWSKVVMSAAGVKYKVVGLENLDPDAGYIFAGNHESAFDIPLAFAGLPYQMVSISKKELAKIPIFGWAMAAGKHIFVDRKNHARALESLKKAEESLKKYPRSILLFPEGTRSTDGIIKKFKPGGMILGMNCNMSIVPIAICGTFDVNVKGSLKLVPGNTELRIGKPIATDGFTYDDRNDLAEKVRSEVVKLKDSWQRP